MARVLLSGKIHDDGFNLLKAEAGIELVEMPDNEAASFGAMLPEADALLIRTANLPPEAIAVADRLKVVSRHGVGYDNVPVDALTAKGIPLALAVGSNADTVAEHAFYLMLAVAKNGFASDRAVRDGAWEIRNAPATFDIGGRTLFLIGFGRVGHSMARMAKAFSMRVLAFDPLVDAAQIVAGGAEPVDDWRAALPEVDVVSLHTPRLPETENMIAAAELAAMRADAILINTSRGGLIDEKALAEALNEGRLAGAGIDTFDVEPPGTDNPLLSCDRVVLTPHNAGLTREAAARLSLYAARNVIDALAGRLDPAVVVNHSVLAS